MPERILGSEVNPLKNLPFSPSPIIKKSKLPLKFAVTPFKGMTSIFKFEKVQIYSLKEAIHAKISELKLELDMKSHNFDENEEYKESTKPEINDNIRTQEKRHN